MLDHLIVDLRQTWRALTAKPGWTVGTVGVLAVGLALAAAMFAVADPYLFRPLPYPEWQRLVVLKIRPSAAMASAQQSPPTLEEWQARSDLFEHVAVYGEYERLHLNLGDAPIALSLRRVSPNFAQVVGAPRDSPATWSSVSQGALPLWVAGASPSTRQTLMSQLGRVVKGDQGDLVVVAGVMPASFLFPTGTVAARPDVVVPAAIDDLLVFSGGRTSAMTGIARLQPHVSVEAVEAAMGPELAARGIQLVVEPLSHHMTGGLRMAALGAVAAALLIVVVCAANSANLVVARGLYRVRDFATREALGASRFDLMRLTVIELAVVIGTSGAIAVTASHILLRLIERTLPPEYRALGDPAMDFRTAMFVVVMSAALFAICLPAAWWSARSTGAAAFNRAQHGEWRGARPARLVLTASQTAVAIFLVVGGALLARSYENLWSQETGYAGQALIARVTHGAGTSGARGLKDAALVEQVEQTMEAIRRVPEVTGVAAGVGIGALFEGVSSVGGNQLEARSVKVLLRPTRVTPDYFDVAGTRVLMGRTFQHSDRGRPVVVLSRAMARRLFGDAVDGRTVGQTLLIDRVSHDVIGVVQDVHDRALDRQPSPKYYLPLETGSAAFGRVSYVLRVGGVVSDVALRRAIASVDTGAVLDVMDSIDGRLADGIRDRTFVTIVLSLFAAASLGITAIGVFAMTAFVVARRTREIAIRIAVGAGAHHIGRLVMRDAMLAVASGALVGFGVARAFANVLESYLFGVASGDLGIQLMAAFGLLVVTALAAWWPARRAQRLQPTIALRVE